MHQLNEEERHLTEVYEDMKQKYDQHMQQQSKYSALHTGWRHGDRQDTMRVRAGWHHTKSPADEEARLSFDGRTGIDTNMEPVWNEIMTLRADGHVGVGTKDPLDALHIIGNNYIEGNLKLGTGVERFHSGKTAIQNNMHLFVLQKY